MAIPRASSGNRSRRSILPLTGFFSVNLDLMSHVGHCDLVTGTVYGLAKVRAADASMRVLTSAYRSLPGDQSATPAAPSLDVCCTTTRKILCISVSGVTSARIIGSCCLVTASPPTTEAIPTSPLPWQVIYFFMRLDILVPIVAAAAIVAIRGMHETAHALKTELDSRGVAHLTSTLTVR
jgi:hypothetical protein